MSAKYNRGEWVKTYSQYDLTVAPLFSVVLPGCSISSGGDGLGRREPAANAKINILDKEYTQNRSKSVENKRNLLFKKYF